MSYHNTWKKFKIFVYVCIYLYVKRYFRFTKENFIITYVQEVHKSHVQLNEFFNAFQECAMFEKMFHYYKLGSCFHYQKATLPKKITEFEDKSIRNVCPVRVEPGKKAEMKP